MPLCNYRHPGPERVKAGRVAPSATSLPGMPGTPLLPLRVPGSLVFFWDFDSKMGRFSGYLKSFRTFCVLLDTFFGCFASRNLRILNAFGLLEKFRFFDENGANYLIQLSKWNGLGFICVFYGSSSRPKSLFYAIPSSIWEGRRAQKNCGSLKNLAFC